MLSRENKFLLLAFCCLLFVACNKKNEDLQKIRSQCYAESMSEIGIRNYLDIYDAANDSIKTWILNDLESSRGEKLRPWLLDSLFCFNQANDKFITVISVQGGFGKEFDYLDYLYGVKITDQWYFFYGPTLVVRRSNYQENVTTPLSFEKLKLIATKRIYQYYLKKRGNGQWEINEDFFQDLTSVAWCGNCVTKAEWDSVYLSVVRRNWLKRDTTNYE